MGCRAQPVRYPISRTVQQMTRETCMGQPSYTEFRILPEPHAKQHFHREARLYGGVAIALLATSPACRHGIPAQLRVEPTSWDIAPQYPAGQWIVSAPRRLNASL